MKNKVISILLSVLLVVTSFIPMAYAVDPVVEVFGNWDIVNPTNADNGMPEKLIDGQIWAGKKVTYKGNGEFDVELNAIGQKYRVEKNNQYDVVLVLDRSYSMKGQRIQDMKKAAKSAVKEILKVEGNRVAIISYASMADQGALFSENESAVLKAIDAVNVDNNATIESYTNIQNALFQTEKLLVSRGNSDRKSAVILMSDGEPVFHHTSLDDQSKGNRVGNGYPSSQQKDSWKFSWYTILQAKKLKDAIPNIQIYTIGMGAISAEGQRTLMPTDENTSSVRPSSYYEFRNVEQVRDEIHSKWMSRYRDAWRWTKWHDWNYEEWSKWTKWSEYKPTDDIGSPTYSLTGDWSILNDVSKDYKSSYGNWVLSGNFVETELIPTKEWDSYLLNTRATETEIQTQFAKTQANRTGTEYQKINSRLPFNHKYYQDLSRISGDGEAAILEIFTKIAKDITEFEPNQHKTEDKSRSSVIISDVIGEGFELVDPEKYTYNSAARTLTWTILGDELKSQAVGSKSIDMNAMNTLKFTVRLKEDLKTMSFEGLEEGITYYTNLSAEAGFDVLDNNPAYEGTAVKMDLTQKGSLTLIPGKGVVLVKHVDENNQKLADDMIYTQVIGTSVTTTQANVGEKYELRKVTPSLDNGTVTLKVTRAPQEVIFTYGLKPTLDMDVKGEGRVTPPKGQYVYPKGEKVEIAAYPEDGHKFIGWEGEGVTQDANGKYYVDMSVDRKIVAQFIKDEAAKEVTLTTSINIPGAGELDHTKPTPHKQGDVVTVNVTKVNEGFTFVNWSDAANTTSTAITVTLDQSMELVANFVKNDVSKFALSASVNDEKMGAITGTADGSYSKDTPISLEAAAKKDHKFVHWTKNGEIYSDQSKINFNITEDTKLVAVFAPEDVVVKEYQLTAFVMGKGSIVTTFKNGKYAEGTEVTLKAQAEPGHKFTGWTGDVTKTDETITFKMTKDMTVTAVFVEDAPIAVKHNLNATVNGGGKITGTANGNYDPQTEVTLTATANEGHRFIGWTGDMISSNPTLTFKLEKNTNLIANFEPIPVYTLKINVVGEGLTTPINSEYREGTPVTVTASPKNGYRFVGWSGDLTSNKSEDTIVMNANKVLTATFVKIEKVSLTVNIIGEGTVTPDVRTFDKGAQITLVANPATNWRFDRWTGDAPSFERTITLTMDTDKTVVAQFAAIDIPGPGPDPVRPTPIPPTPAPEPAPTPTPTPEAEVVIDTEPTPESPATEEVTLDDESVPEGASEETKPAEPVPAEEVIELTDEVTPEGSALPQTGQLPTSIFFGIGSVIMAAGVYLKRK